LEVATVGLWIDGRCWTAHVVDVSVLLALLHALLATAFEELLRKLGAIFSLT
jgi:hypothetical protein